jgi:hypothetical protein
METLMLPCELSGSLSGPEASDERHVATKHLLLCPHPRRSSHCTAPSGGNVENGSSSSRADA